MTAQLRPLDALHQHLGWEPNELTLLPLDGGLTNHSFEVRKGTARFVLRLDTPFSKALPVDRERELSVLSQAFAAGVGPETVFAAPADGILVTRYLEGRPWSPADLQDAANLKAVCQLLRRVHELPVTGNRFLPAAIARSYWAQLDTNTDGYEFAERCVAVIEECATALTGSAIRCCHNDVVAQNLVGQPAPTLIDWDYACDNDPFFDLASLLTYHELSDALAARWLSEFTGGTRPEHREQLALQRRIYAALSWLWLALREAVAPGSEQRKTLQQLQRSIGKR